MAHQRYKRQVASHIEAVVDQARKALSGDDYVDAPEFVPEVDTRKLRTQVLQTAESLTSGDREAAYGDPLDNFQTATALKNVFWNSFDAIGDRQPRVECEHTTVAGKVCDVNVRNLRMGRNSPHGHAIDMILTNLARIATQPSAEASQDRYVDIAGYAALAFEVAKRSA